MVTKNELIKELMVQRKKSVSVSAEKKNTSMSHQDQLDAQVKNWNDGLRSSNHAYRILRGLANASNVVDAKMDDEVFITMISEEAWDAVVKAYEAYCAAAVEAVRPLTITADEKSHPVKTVSERDAVYMEIGKAVAAGDKIKVKELQARLTTLLQ